MAKVRVKLDLRGLNRLMSSKGVQDRVDEIGRSMADDAGAGFEYSASPHRWTARGFVQTNGEGTRRQAKDAVLERVVTRRH